MASRIPIGERRDPRWFLSPLSSAFFELVLIILLYIHALLSYLVYKFARCCKLPNPCMLCPRLDRRRPSLFKELICNSHKLEVSSLVYCRSHRRLADANEMCDGCLLHVVGKVGKHLDEGIDADNSSKRFHGEDIPKVPLLKKDLEPASLSKRCCSCCSAPMQNKHRLLQGKYVAEPDGSLSGSHLRNGLTKESDCSKSIGVCHGGDNRFQIMSHVGLTSDSELEAPILDEDDSRSSLSRGIGDVKEELLCRCLQAAPSASVPKNFTQVTSADMVPEKLIHLCPVMPDASVTERRLQMSDSLSATGTGHGLEEMNWSQAEVKPNFLVRRLLHRRDHSCSSLE